MKFKLNIVLYLLLSTGLLIGMFSCAPSSSKESNSGEATSPKPEKNVVSIEAVNFFESSSEDKVSKNEGLVRCSGNSWLAYNVNIPAPGRYKFDVQLKSNSDTATIWMEDYIYNPDDRTYNITGSIPVNPGNAMQSHGVIGSPLNSGLHKMRLHTDGDVQIKNFKFELIRPHEKTPKVMKQDMDGDKYELVWSDEFEKSGLPDTTKWTFDIGNWGWGNNELQYYTVKRLKNARCENGNLIIQAHKNDMGEDWTSARLTTRGKVSFIYGKIEFRAKVPPNRGNWAAGWTLGDDYVDELSWPYCGEIDILESVGYEMDDETGNGTAHASAHCAAYYFKLGNQPTGTIPVENMHEAYHTYAVEWSPEQITATVDGTPYFTYSDTSSELSWPFSDPQNIILNLTMGGGWGGLKGIDPDIETQEMIVDYIRVYKKI
jgi:beta-glucanase (GH16 family)